MSTRYPWYDSVWLERYRRALEIFRERRPERAEAFARDFDRFRTRPDFRPVRLAGVFDSTTMDQIRRSVRSLRPQDLELHEARGFGRFVVHNHPDFRILHRNVVELVGDIAGEPVEPSYSFLSMYTRRGRCPVHMDSPEAKWTLDVCIDRSVPWPLHLSRIVPWPEDYRAPEGADWQAAIKTDASLAFETHDLEPGQALVFSGSSQWHYREPLPDPGREVACDLLFFHFVPKGCRELVRVENWARLFDAPELAELVPPDERRS